MSMQRGQFPRLNDRQKELAEIVRKALRTDSFEETPLAHSLSESIAVLIDGFNHGASPNHLGPIMQLMWKLYLKLCEAEQRHALSEIVGDADRVDDLYGREDVGEILTQIFRRTGPILPGQDVPKIDIADLVQQYNF